MSTMNEEKVPLWFVWERATRGGMIANLQPALYRGMPRTGAGQIADDARFVFKHELLPEEQTWNLDQLTEKYPCPTDATL